MFRIHEFSLGLMYLNHDIFSFEKVYHVSDTRCLAMGSTYLVASMWLNRGVNLC